MKTAVSEQVCPNITQCRLLYLVGQLGLGGLERQLYLLLANMDRARYKPAIAVWNFDPDEKYYRDLEALKIPIRGFPATWSPLSKLHAVRSLVRHFTPEVIHSYGFHTNFAAYYAGWRTGAVAIGSIRGNFTVAKREGGILRGALNARWPAVHISNSQASADEANRAAKPFKPQRVFVVRNGLNLKQFINVENLHQKRTYVAAVGSLLPVKRWDRLLRAFQRIKIIADDDVCLRIAGDGPLRSTLEHLAGDLGISGNVEFLGAIHDIPAFLKGARLLVHTSESEGCPNAVIEAMACGLPVIAMEAGDIAFLMEDGKTGFVIPQGDEASLAKRLTELLRDTERCLNMGVAGREKASREFTLDRLVGETLAVYRAAGWKDTSADDLPPSGARDRNLGIHINDGYRTARSAGAAGDDSLLCSEYS
ncbi:MAG: glycosyltransferase family 4 protein [Nitrospira sp.]